MLVKLSIKKTKTISTVLKCVFFIQHQYLLQTFTSKDYILYKIFTDDVTHNKACM